MNDEGRARLKSKTRYNEYIEKIIADCDKHKHTKISVNNRGLIIDASYILGDFGVFGAKSEPSRPTVVSEACGKDGARRIRNLPRNTRREFSAFGRIGRANRLVIYVDDNGNLF